MSDSLVVSKRARGPRGKPTLSHDATLNQVGYPCAFGSRRDFYPALSRMHSVNLKCKSMINFLVRRRERAAVSTCLHSEAKFTPFGEFCTWKLILFSFIFFLSVFF